ncbi:AraC family transcriptional regulator [Vibrio sp. AK197]
MKQDHFEYASSQHIEGVKAFNATMTSFTYDKHAHEEYAIGVTRKGRQDYFSDGAFHKSYAGNVMCFNPEQVHDGSAGAHSTLEYDMLYIPPAKLIPLMRTMGLTHLNQARVSDSVFNDPILRQQILTMCSLLNQDDSQHVDQEAGLISIAESLVRLSGAKVITSKSYARKDTLLLRSKEFILCNLENPITSDDMSEAANMSKYHFIRLFREQFGITPHQYLLNCRINRARQALEQGTSALDVALSLGFSDASHLNRKFKRVFGITPKQYQRQFSR